MAKKRGAGPEPEQRPAKKTKLSDLAADRSMASAGSTRLQPTDRHKAFDDPGIQIPDFSNTGGDLVQRVGLGEYLFTINLDDLREFHRIAWCVRDHVTAVSVRIACLPDDQGRNYFGFCVHLLPAASTWKPRHAYTFTNVPWSGPVACSSVENMLTYCLSCELYDRLCKPYMHTGSIPGLLKRILTSNPGTMCVVCKRSRSVRLWRPAACSTECEQIFQGWPLDVRLSPLTRDIKVLDFLLCTVKSAAYGRTQEENDSAGFTILNNCPVPLERVAEVIDSFTPVKSLRSGATAWEWIGMDALLNDKRNILSWLASEFSGCLIQATEDQHASAFSAKTCHQFVLMNSRPSRYGPFLAHVGGRLLSDWTWVPGGTVAFHGTAGNRVFSILSDSLRDAQKNGYNVPRQGVFYADEPSYSEYYLRKTPILPWTGSRFTYSLVMLGVELFGPKPATGGAGFTLNESEVNVRYLFVMECDVTKCPSDVRGFVGGGYGVPGTTEHLQGELRDKLPLGKEVRDTMQETYRRIHSGRLQ